MAVLLLVLIIQTNPTILLFQLSLSILPTQALITKIKALLAKVELREFPTMGMKIKSPM
jgi:hypothetical protein